MCLMPDEMALHDTASRATAAGLAGNKSRWAVENKNKEHRAGTTSHSCTCKRCQQPPYSVAAQPLEGEGPCRGLSRLGSMVDGRVVFYS